MKMAPQKSGYLKLLMEICHFTIENRANSSQFLRHITLDHTHDTNTKVTAKMSLFMPARSHMTNFDDLEATEVLLILASDLCFTFLAVGSNPSWGVVFFGNRIKIQNRFSFNQNDYFGTIIPP